ncbi:MAG: acyltransferase [Tidjanibacter sp.]|nr:acyltransferase [Tidjanibacter sp.]
MKNRYYFLDNLRWVTVLLVLFYHVFYNFNSVGVFGGIGGFGPNQWQDIFCTLLNPWFMTLMFVVAGASSRYALRGRSPKEFRKERTRKLLVPSTLGLLVFGGVLGYFNMKIAGAAIPTEVPAFVRYLIMVISGTGPLWFIQDLFVFSLLLLVVRKIIDAERIDKWLSKLPNWGIGAVLVALFAIMWWASQSQIDNPSAAQGLLNLYRPIFYFVAFLVGYYIFSSERTHTYLAQYALPLIGLAVASAAGFCMEFYGKDYTSPEAVQGIWGNLYCFTATLAMFGSFSRWANHTSPFAGYMTRSSFGLYIVHMSVCTASCYLLKESELPIWSIYCLALVATYVGSVVLWEALRRIPVVRWCVFGIKRQHPTPNTKKVGKI